MKQFRAWILRATASDLRSVAQQIADELARRAKDAEDARDVINRIRRLVEV